MIQNNVPSQIQDFSDQNYRISFKQQSIWKKYLEKNGFVVIKNFLSKDVCEKFVQQFWSILELLSQGKLNRKQPKSQILGKNYPPVLHGGMIQYIGHSECQWKIRRSCKPIFLKLWKTNQLKSSFDGFCFMNGKRKYQPRSDNAFLHVDQSPTRDYLWSYQGIMCLTESGQNGGGFVCVPKSHKYHNEYFKQNNLLGVKSDWFVVPQKDKMNKVLSKVLKVNNEAGDFILFDSRTFHCNTVPKQQILRVCTYVCMIPEKKMGQEVKQKRKKAVKERRTSTHHPGDGFKIFPKLPRYLQDPRKFEGLVREINFAYKLSEEDEDLI